MSDNPQFDSILEAEFGGEEEFMDFAVNAQIEEIVSNFSDDVVELKLHDGTTFHISERHGYEMMSLMAVQFNWNAYVFTVQEICGRIEHLLGKEMPDAVKTAMTHITEESAFWLNANGLIPHHNILLAFFLTENGVMGLDDLQQVVQLELNNMTAVLQDSPSYKMSAEIANEDLPETIEECRRLLAEHRDNLPQEVIDYIESMISEED